MQRKVLEIMFSTLCFIISVLCWTNNNFLQKIKVFFANNFILQNQCRPFLFLKNKIQVKMVLKVFQQFLSYETSAQNEMRWIPIWNIKHEWRAEFVNHICILHTNVDCKRTCVYTYPAILTSVCLITTARSPKSLCSNMEPSLLASCT